MNAQFWVVQAFNGVSYGALLFLVGSGLSLIFGVMRIVNLSHGAYFLWGGYIALSVIAATGSWALSLPLAALAVAAIGIAMERLFLRSEGFEHVRNGVIGASVGILVALAITARWGQFIGSGSTQVALLAVGAAGHLRVIDGGADRGVGIDTNRVSMFIFALGAFLAALGGVIGGAFLGIYPGLDFEMLPLAFAVVIIGGMGSLGGAAIGALAVGLADNFGKALFPEISYFTLYAPMVLILAVKPTGLFGRE